MGTGMGGSTGCWASQAAPAHPATNSHKLGEVTDSWQAQGSQAVGVSGREG